MIARLTGNLVEKTFNTCVVDANGVGYEVNIPLSTFDKLPLDNEKVTLFIYTQVREDAIVLFGFFSAAEKDLFKLLLNVNGIGGKLALSVLSAMPIDNFCNAIAHSDLKTLSRISGIGKKTAERLILELKDKLSAGTAASVFTIPAAGGAANPNNAATDAAMALEQLGFKRDAIDKVIKLLLAELPQAEHTSEILLRQAIIKLNF